MADEKDSWIDDLPDDEYDRLFSPSEDERKEEQVRRREQESYARTMALMAEMEAEARMAGERKEQEEAIHEWIGRIIHPTDFCEILKRTGSRITIPQRDMRGARELISIFATPLRSIAASRNLSEEDTIEWLRDSILKDEFGIHRPSLRYYEDEEEEDNEEEDNEEEDNEEEDLPYEWDLDNPPQTTE